MNIVNIIHIGDKSYNMDELPEEIQKEIGWRLNKQAMEAIGYRMREEQSNSPAWENWLASAMK